MDKFRLAVELGERLASTPFFSDGRICIATGDETFFIEDETVEFQTTAGHGVLNSNVFRKVLPDLIPSTNTEREFGAEFSKLLAQ